MKGGATSYQKALDTAISAAREAGVVLRKELHRPGGPRGAGGHAEVDVEAERLTRVALLEAFPDYGFRGEETGFRAAGDKEDHLWLVDPNDGTSKFLKGQRGSAVSIGLVCQGVPVLGVVYAFAAPDDAGDLFAWAEGCGPPTRNRHPLSREWPQGLAADQIVLVSTGADKRPRANARCVAPARFRAMPSLAYRLALVAAGEGDACVALRGLTGWDYAAGDAILRAVGGVLVDERGRTVSYRPDGTSGVDKCFGGARELVRELATRPWATVLLADDD